MWVTCVCTHCAWGKAARVINPEIAALTRRPGAQMDGAQWESHGEFWSKSFSICFQDEAGAEQGRPYKTLNVSSTRGGERPGPPACMTPLGDL